MDQVTRLRIEIEHSAGILRRIDASGLATDTDRRYARTLRQSIAEKQELVRKLDGWLTKKH